MKAHGVSKDTETSGPKVHYLPTYGEGGITGILFYSAVIYFALLAYPRYEEREKLKRFAYAMAIPALKKFVSQGGDPSILSPDFRIKREKVQGALNMGIRRIGWRVTAASIAYGLCANGVYVPYDVPTSHGSTGVIFQAPDTVNKAVQALLDTKAPSGRDSYFSFDSAAVNVKHRIWASSLPVLHLSLALYPHIYRVGNRPNNITCLIREPQWLRGVLSEAERIRWLLPLRIPSFKPQDAVCILPIDHPFGVTAAQSIT